MEIQVWTPKVSEGIGVAEYDILTKLDGKVFVPSVLQLKATFIFLNSQVYNFIFKNFCLSIVDTQCYIGFRCTI